MKFKRYWVFVILRCYPLGGMDDLKHSFDDIPTDEQIELLTPDDEGRIEVYDSNDNKLIKYFEFDFNPRSLKRIEIDDIDK